MEPLRTTLTLDPDVAARLRETANVLGLGWKETVNRVLRAGLDQSIADAPAPRKVTLRVYDGGVPLLPGVHSVHDMLVHAEGEDFR
ncbi:MAG: hypothetical protein IV100_04740 [Myxococcales bacterium]|nr:hypothetical protein [Myxococcales bacterium]